MTWMQAIGVVLVCWCWVVAIVSTINMLVEWWGARLTERLRRSMWAVPLYRFGYLRRVR